MSLELALSKLASEASYSSQAPSDRLVITTGALQKIKQFIARSTENITAHTQSRAPPALQLEAVAADDVAKASQFAFFGRLRRDTSVEHLAGTAPLPEIVRPVELTLVPESVSSFEDATCALRHCSDVCTLLANQCEQMRNTFPLRAALIQHLFMHVLPHPVPVTNPDRTTQCFWWSKPIRRETQNDLLRLLWRVANHFGAACLSLNCTQSFDAARVLTVGSIAALVDVLIRKQAIDIPSQFGAHYSGTADGPVKPFGFCMSQFGLNSETLRFDNAQLALSRVAVLDYFDSVSKAVQPGHMLGTFEKSTRFNDADRMLMNQLCLQLGYDRGNQEQPVDMALYWTGQSQTRFEHLSSLCACPVCVLS